MIALLRGKIAGRTGNSIIIDVNGVGYLVHTSLKTFEKAGQLNDDISMLIHTIVREDAFILYGFIEEDEKDVFQILIKVPQLGPKVALSLLSCFSVGDLLLHIVEGNVKALTGADGVGVKVASRLVTELSEKAKLFHVKNGESDIKNKQDDVFEEVKNALKGLGFRPMEISELIKKVKSLEGIKPNTPSLISACLKLANNKE